MIRNYLVVAFRNLLRYKAISFINIGGLALSMASSLFLLYYISFELGYDDFHVNAKNIHLLHHDIYKNGSKESSSIGTYHGAAPSMLETIPGVAGFVRLHRADGMFSYHNTAKGEMVSHHETKSFYADSTFFSVFSFPLISGNPDEVLRNPNSMVISESAARKYFGNENPLGKVISPSTEWQGGDYVVEGVFKDIPENSHLQFDFLLAIENLLKNDQFINGGWYWTNFTTYLLLKPEVTATDVERQFPAVIETHLGSYLRKMKSEERFRLENLNDVHLNSENVINAQASGDSKMVLFMIVIAFLIVGIAWINYINLSTAKATERAREVGMRKIFGSQRKQLIVQFLLESCIPVLLAVVVAGVIMAIMWTPFAQLIGKKIEFSLYGQTSFWIIAGGVITIGTILSCVYPAFVLSSFEPASTIKGKFMNGIKGALLRKVLVVAQFSAAILLIISTITISSQIAFMREQDLGMQIEQKIILRGPKLIKGDSYLNDMEVFKNTIRSNAGVNSVTASSEVPGKEIFWTNEFRLFQEDEEVRKMTSILAVDEDFIPAYDIQILAGRNFSKDRAGDFGATAVINETALKLLGFKQPEEAINQQIIVANHDIQTIVGVIGNFHQQSLKQITQPLLLTFIPWNQDFITLSVDAKNYKQTLSTIGTDYRKIFPGNAFEYFFLDEYFERQYESDRRSWKLFIFFASLAVVVACMGLFGLSSFMALKRTKEIAIRKVLGADVSSLSMMMSREYLQWVLIAFAVTTPAAWLLMDKWLQDFAYRISVPWWAFVVAGAMTVMIAWLTVVFNLSSRYGQSR